VRTGMSFSTISGWLLFRVRADRTRAAGAVRKKAFAVLVLCQFVKKQTRECSRAFLKVNIVKGTVGVPVDGVQVKFPNSFVRGSFLENFPQT
jgi:hypothetical protein